MSGRPRPVTATVTKPDWMKVELLCKPRRTSLDSSGSTESLVSVLDHDSYESLPDSDDEDGEGVVVTDVYTRKSESRQARQGCEDIINSTGFDEDTRVPRLELDSTFTINDSNNSSNIQANNQSYVINNNRNNNCDDRKSLTWEHWVIKKATEEQLMSSHRRDKQKEEKILQESEEKLKVEKLLKANEKQKEWLEKKNYVNKLRSKLEKQRLSAEKEIEEMKKREIDEKSEQKYKQWMTDKRKMERQKKKSDKETKMEEEQKKKEKDDLSVKKYNEWLEKVKSRPKSSPPTSYGYRDNGQLTSYYDLNAYPEPAYVNPVAWVQTVVPKSKSETSKKKKRHSKSARRPYVWNPEKYF